jgi:ABC-type transport system involved in multi-copper enzyme maturation permease subunit
MNPSIILDVIRFELTRSFTKGRMAIWGILVAFPVALFVLMDRTNNAIRIEQWGITLYILIPEMVCLLSLLLWATPSISTEIEGQTWIYLAMRRSGRSMVLIGKYLTAVFWSLSAALLSVTLCLLLVDNVGGMRLWTVLSILSVLSCFAHAGIFMLIGVFFHRRTMVTAVFYTLAIEYGLSLVPAVANKVTVNYRLRGLLAEWMDWEEARSTAESFFGHEEPHIHLFVLFTITVVTLFAAIFALARAEYPTQQDG